MKATLSVSLAVGALALASMPVAAQPSDPAIARLADGKPDLNGVWQALGSAHYDIERHMARASLQLREGPHGPLADVPLLRLGAVGAVPGGMGVVEGGKIPYTPEAAAKREENRKNWLERDPEIKCYMPGVPRATYMPFPFQIFHNENSIFIAYEFAGATREIYLEDVGPPETDSWMGQSAGHWEGDTLVVDVTGLDDRTWLDRSGTHHSYKMHVVERYTPIGPNHLRYEATIEDPEVFTRPWKISLPLYRRIDEGARLMDFKCVEFVEELIYGEYRRKPLER